MINVLVTGAGGSAARNFIKCLRLAGGYFIVGTDTESHHLRCNDLLDIGCNVPMCSDSSYLDELRRICIKYDIEIVHPQPDCEVSVLSKSDMETALPEYEIVQICQDKFVTHQVLSKVGAPTPRTTNVDECVYPSWVRSRFGAGSKAALPVANKTQLDGWLNYWKFRGIPSSDFIASEILPGREYAFQSLWWNGDLVASAARCRLEYAGGAQSPSGQTSSPSIAVSVHDEKVNAAAVAAVMAVTKGRPHGVFCVDLKEDESGNPKTTEINAGRFFTTSDFFATAGCNMPHMYIQLAIGNNVSSVGHNAVASGIYWIRGMDRNPRLKT